MFRHPRFQIPCEIRRDGDPGIGCLGLRLSDAVRALLLFLHGFVYAELIGADVFKRKSQQFSWTEAAKQEYADYEILSPCRDREKLIHFRERVKTFP